MTDDRNPKGIPSGSRSRSVQEITRLFRKTHTVTANASASYALIVERREFGGVGFDVLAERLAYAQDFSALKANVACKGIYQSSFCQQRMAGLHWWI